MGWAEAGVGHRTGNCAKDGAEHVAEAKYRQRGGEFGWDWNWSRAETLNQN